MSRTTKTAAHSVGSVESFGIAQASASIDPRKGYTGEPAVRDQSAGPPLRRAGSDSLISPTWFPSGSSTIA